MCNDAKSWIDFRVFNTITPILRSLSKFFILRVLAIVKGKTRFRFGAPEHTSKEVAPM